MKATNTYRYCFFIISLFFLGYPSNVMAQATMIKDIYPGNQSGGGYQDYYVLGQKFYFPADSCGNGYCDELWTSDGTSSGTNIVKIIHPIKTAPGALSNEQPEISNGRLFFGAFDTSTVHPRYGIWRSDGTSSGTILLYSFSNSSTQISIYGNINANTFFINPLSNGAQLWITNGTPAGTIMVKQFSGISLLNVGALTYLNGYMYFFATDGGVQNGLWKSDGTTLGTTFVIPVNLGATTDINGNSIERDLINVNSMLYFRANTSASGSELWKSDGTASGTIMVKDINPGSTSSDPEYLTSMNGILYFKAETSNGIELWKSDGTTSGTVLVKDINPGTGYGFLRNKYQTIKVLNKNLFFLAYDGVHGSELWKSDGTSSGTVLVKDINVGSNGSDPNMYSAVHNNDVLFFNAYSPAYGRELWKTDGSDAGTIRITDINPGTKHGLFSGARKDLVMIGDTLYFRAIEDAYGYEPWKLSLPTVSINVSALADTLYCPGDSILIPFTLSGGSINPGNIYIAQLSDTSSGFSNPFVIGTLASTNSTGIVKSLLPITLVPGKKYNVRVVSSNFQGVGTNKGRNIYSNQPPVISTTPSDSTTVCFGNSINLSASGASKYLWSPSFGLNKSDSSAVVSTPTATTTYTVTGVNNNTGCSSSSKIKVAVNLCTGVIGEIAKINYTVFPNPGNGSFALLIQNDKYENISIEITDVTGKSVYAQILTVSPGDNSYTIDLPKCMNGIYLLRGISSRNVVNKKVLVQN